jgi:hypothetical protein
MRTLIWGEMVLITKNGKFIYAPRRCDIGPDGGLVVKKDGKSDWVRPFTLMKFENLARRDPDNDWRYYHLSEMHDETYQRHGKNYWPIVRSGRGYA